MGKRIISQRRGRGTIGYRAPSHRYIGKVNYRTYDDKETGLIKGKIVDLVHSIGHQAPLSIIKFETGDMILVPATLGIRVGDEITSGAKSKLKTGNIIPLNKIPEGTNVSNIESAPGKSAFCRTSGTFAKVVSRKNNKVMIKFPSKKEKILDGNCRATIGIVGGGGRRDKPIIKAGKAWHMMHARGKLYPKTSGVAMNAVDHPFGSGRGRHIGKPKTAPRFAPPGRNVGLIKAKRAGKKK